MGELVSYLSGIFLLIISLMVMIAFWPSLTRNGFRVLGVAIFLSFFAAAMNTIWWQVFAYWNTQLGVFPRDQFREFGYYVDFVMKALLGGGAGILHLVALQRQLPDEERNLWSWWDMPWYPERKACLTRLIGRVKNKE